MRKDAMAQVPVVEWGGNLVSWPDSGRLAAQRHGLNVQDGPKAALPGRTVGVETYAGGQNLLTASRSHSGASGLPQPGIDCETASIKRK